MQKIDKEHITNILKSIVILLISLQASSAEMGDFFRSVKKYIGTYQVSHKNSGFCDSGNLDFIDAKAPTKGLRLGQRLFLGEFSKKEHSEVNSDGCLSSTSFQFQKNKVTQISKISNCPVVHKKFETKSTQILELKDNTITYTSVEGGIKCKFKKEAK